MVTLLVTTLTELILLMVFTAGVVKNLYVWNTDRLSRNQITWYSIRQKMVKNNVVLYTSQGKYDITDGLENLLLGILSEVSTYDNLIRAERSRLGKIEKVQKNYWRGGDCPFGYKLSKSDNIGKFKDVNSNNFNSKYFGFFQNYRLLQIFQKQNYV